MISGKYRAGYMYFINIIYLAMTKPIIFIAPLAVSQIYHVYFRIWNSSQTCLSQSLPTLKWVHIHKQLYNALPHEWHIIFLFLMINLIQLTFSFLRLMNVSVKVAIMIFRASIATTIKNTRSNIVRRKKMVNEASSCPTNLTGIFYRNEEMKYNL